MLKVLGISGSLRENSNTEYLVRYALSLFPDTEFKTELVSLKELVIKPCQGCYGCLTARKCVQEDDDFEFVYQKMAEADGLIIGTPVYFSSVHPQLMALLDRAGFVRLWTGEQFSGKVGGPITVARRAGHNTAFAQLLLWFFINDIIVPGSSYWTMAVAGSRGARDAAKDEEGLRHITKFVKNMSRVMKALQVAPDL
ncbi:Multimeric flavodoxin WrbA [Thermanaeromonas toyohensis ToBE]|uniref:Multimeric flavodoxin WrbA n=1 Tax=Thermanaeromonas toyohensis ToBE TaxID=698762 RepID=A0A1W1W171_9FIRM|nr:flavodoxin family protein [Thermanaeromonas toyohensis]SMB99230.1 Multimeric flavodoxin WrbA [Thermanaeromonas toyohensis ToBE]